MSNPENSWAKSNLTVARPLTQDEYVAFLESIGMPDKTIRRLVAVLKFKGTVEREDEAGRN